MVKHKPRRQRFFASAAHGKKGKWSNEDWSYTFVLIGFILLVYYLAESYKPGKFVEPYLIEDEYFEDGE